MKKTMRKSALLSSVAMLIVSAIVLTSATYAWFSSSKVVYVEELEASVKVSTGLLISVDKGGEWSTSVDFADAVAVKNDWGAGYPSNMVFDPVSSEDAQNWITAVYEETGKDAEGNILGGLNITSINPGTKFVAVPLWVSGPVGEEVEAEITFNADEQAAKCVKFALVPASGDNGDVIGDYTEAVAATPNDDNKFRGISATGTTETSGAYVVTTGGKEINEVAAKGGINFTIPEGTDTSSPMKFVAFIWLEGNDADCDMLEFDVKGEDISFEMLLKLKNA